MYYNICSVPHPSHLIILSQASTIFSKDGLAEKLPTLESSSQAPLACSASVCEMRLVINDGVNLFCFDQMLKALPK